MKPDFLLTSGGTKIALDSVRSITNMSRGTFGSKIAYEIITSHYDLTFLNAKDSRLPCVPSCFQYAAPTFVTFEDYERQLMLELDRQPSIIILAAAVSDYGVENYVDGKIRSSDELVIRLKPLPKLISRVRSLCPMSSICGFKLLVNSTDEELTDAATKSLIDNRLDLVVANDLRDIRAGEHRLIIVEKSSVGNNVVVSVHKENLPNVVVEKCLKHWQLGILR